jgi:hypothetical protein
MTAAGECDVVWRWLSNIAPAREAGGRGNKDIFDVGDYPGGI